jgi:integrase
MAQAELLAWKRECGEPAQDAFLFSDSGRPLSKRIWLEERLRPVAVSVEVKTPVTFQVFRRTFATLMQKCGTVKDVQRMMRHSSPNLTVGVYMQAIPDSVKEAVKSLEDMLAIPEPQSWRAS